MYRKVLIPQLLRFPGSLLQDWQLGIRRMKHVCSRAGYQPSSCMYISLFFQSLIFRIYLFLFTPCNSTVCMCAYVCITINIILRLHLKKKKKKKDLPSALNHEGKYLQARLLVLSDKLDSSCNIKHHAWRWDLHPWSENFIAQKTAEWV